jgi:metal-responsive CopG/Arc/MetJ family transcriptional regulator
MLSAMSTAIQAELPPELLAQVRAFVEEDWATDVNELVAEALRRYLESHSSQLSETFIREDMGWGFEVEGFR